MLDPPNKKACFNCWRTNHLLRECYAKKRFSFCKNCGRRNVEIEDCPRCAKAYCEYIEEEDHLLAKIELYGDETSSDYYEKKKKTGFQLEKSENCYQAMSVGNNSDPQNGNTFEKKSTTSSDLSRNVRDLVSPDSKTVISDNYKGESKNKQVNGLINSVKTVNLEDENGTANSSKELKKREEQLKESTAFSSQDYDHHITSNAILSSTKTDKIEADATEYKSFEEADNDGEFLNMNSISEMIMEDEDYNDMIIDEDEKSIKSCETGDTLQLFINLLGTVKNLPIEAQNFAVGCFVKSHKQSR